jgi:hypothetical protein
MTGRAVFASFWEGSAFDGYLGIRTPFASYVLHLHSHVTGTERVLWLPSLLERLHIRLFDLRVPQELYDVLAFVGEPYVVIGDLESHMYAFGRFPVA